MQLSDKQGPKAIVGGDPPRSEIAIVLVNWNAWRDCIDCLDSLLGSAPLPFHIYLVDNASTDGSLAKIEQWCAQPTRPQDARDMPGVRRYSAVADPPALPVRRVDAMAPVAATPASGCRISLVESGANRGFAGGNNVGMRLGLAEGVDWFWLLNTDTVVHQQALANLLERGNVAPQAGIVGSTLLYHDHPETVQALGGATVNQRTFGGFHIGIGSAANAIPTKPEAVEARMDYVVGASMLVSRHFVERIGLMQEDYFLYFEELDWATRAQGVFSQRWAPQSLVWHKVGGSSVKVQSEFSERLLLRNRLRFVARFFPARQAAVRRQVWWELVRHLLKRRFAQARLFWSVLRSETDASSPGRAR